jgi:integrase
MATGIRQRHSRRCSRKTGCKCPWEAFIYSPRDEKKIRKTFPTRAAAKTWRNDSMSAVRRNLLRAPTSETLSQAADAWLDAARQGVIRNRSGDPYKPSAIRAYESVLRLRVRPELGQLKVSAVTRNHLQGLVDALVADGLSASGVATTMLPVRAIYRRAIERGDVAVNPTTGLRIPAVRGRRDRIVSPEQCEALLAALRAGDRALWATAMYGGLRRGELLALRVEDIDLATGLIHVRRGWDQVEGEIATKSGKDRRVPIPAVLRDYLDDHLLNLGWSEGLAFGRTRVSPFNDRTRQERADSAWRRAKLKRITLHEARHTYASMMIAAGVNAKALSEFMGHANISITLDIYGHLMPGSHDEAAALLDGYLDRANSQARIAQIAA